MAKTKIHGEYLDPSVISGQTQVTAVGADSMLIFDATDNALKKALLSDLIETVGATPSFTSATISGDLTVDTSTLKVDSSNNRVGIGTTSPDTKLHVFKATAGSITDYSNNALIVENSGDVGISFHTPNANAGHLMFGSPGHQYHSYIRGQYGASTTSTLKFFTDQVNTMTHKAGNVGIGTENCVSRLSLGNPSADGTIDYTKGITFVDTLTSTSNAWVHAAIVTTGSTGFNGNLIFATDGDGGQDNDTSGLSERMRITSAGHVAIASGKRFYFNVNSIANGDTYIDEYSSNEIGITTGGSRKLAVSGGNLYVSGSVNANHNFSDERLKENVVVIPNALQKVTSLRGITFTRKDDGSVGTGLIAQELEKVLPEAVYEAKMVEELENPDTEAWKSINYGNTVGLLVEAIKELKTELNAAKSRIETLEG
jgi:hypothetical protein